MDKTYKKINLPSVFTGRQANHQIPPPPSPDSMLFSGSRTVSWQASLPTLTLNWGEGGGRSNCGRIKVPYEVKNVFVLITKL